MTHDSLALALGFFDGVHLGHGKLFQETKKYHGKSAVLTFDCHPGNHLGRNQVPLLSSIQDRKWLIATKYHIDHVIVSDFSTLCNMNWEDFVSEFLQKELSVQHVVAGHDFRFGQDGLGDTKKLAQKCEDLGITCQIIPAITMDDKIISSTQVRNLIQKGHMKEATTFLGHPHILSNTVQHGNKIGSKVLGFPTVNLSIPQDVIIPKFGVYACRIWIGKKVYLAVTNVGVRPTVTDELDKSVTVEGFLLDFPDTELYGQTLRVEFYHHLRPEMKFENFPALSAQISRDVEETRQFFFEISLSRPIYQT